MPVTYTAEQPSNSEFRALEQHQESTPESFFGGPPILYHAVRSCRLLISPHDLQVDEAFNQWFENAAISDSNWHLKNDVDALVTSE